MRVWIALHSCCQRFSALHSIGQFFGFCHHRVHCLYVCIHVVGELVYRIFIRVHIVGCDWRNLCDAHKSNSCCRLSIFPFWDIWPALTECSKLHRFSVMPSRFAAKYWASISMSFSAFASICGKAVKNGRCICSVVDTIDCVLLLAEPCLLGATQINTIIQFSSIHGKFSCFVLKILTLIGAGAFDFQFQIVCHKVCHVAFINPNRTVWKRCWEIRIEIRCWHGFYGTEYQEKERWISYIGSTDGDSTGLAFVLWF